MPERPPSEDLEVDGSPGVVLRQHSSPGTESLHGIAWSMTSACHHVTFTTGYPLHRENRENGPKKIPVRENTGNLEILTKHTEFGLLNLLIPVILKEKDISIFATKISIKRKEINLFFKVDKSAKSVLFM